MLYFSLIVSAIFLLIVNAVACRTRFFPGGFLVCMATGVIGFGCLMIGLPAVVLQAAGIAVATIIWQVTAGRRRTFVPATFVVTGMAYVLVWFTWVKTEQQGYDQMRADFPLESLEQRVAAPRMTGDLMQLSPFASDRLVQFEQKIADGRGNRSMWLERLHTNATARFVDSPGFGVGRMMHYRPTRERLLGEDEPPALDQPGERNPSAESSAEIVDGRTVTLPDNAHRMHLSSLESFLDPEGFGYVKSRQAVAGFRPHRFTRVPDGMTQWRLQTIDLVGLVTHEEPVVYVSKQLPRMDELKNAPTRPLDEFELKGLEAARQGEDLYASESSTHMRMFGAIRAVKQCTACHGCERGDLLGAFSYALSR